MMMITMYSFITNFGVPLGCLGVILKNPPESTLLGGSGGHPNPPPIHGG
jgi:hypothetical protein